MLLNQTLAICFKLITAILTAEDPKNTKIWLQNETNYQKLPNANFLLATQDQVRYHTVKTGEPDANGKPKTKEVEGNRSWFNFNIYYDLNGKTIEKDSEISVDLLKNPSKYLNANLQVDAAPKNEEPGNTEWTNSNLNADSFPIFMKIIKDRIEAEKNLDNSRKLVIFSDEYTSETFLKKISDDWAKYKVEKDEGKPWSFVEQKFNTSSGNDDISFKLIFGQRQLVKTTAKEKEDAKKKTEVLDVVDVAGSVVEVELKNFWKQIAGTSEFGNDETKAIAGYIFPVEVRMHPVVWWTLAIFTGGLGIFFLISLRKGLK